MSKNRYDNMKETLRRWQYGGFTLKGIRQQKAYVELEARHGKYNNLQARGPTLEDALEGLEKQIDTIHKDNT